jgi:putative aldouronate transport system permease protein
VKTIDDPGSLVLTLPADKPKGKNKKVKTKRTLHRFWRERWMYILALPGVLYFGLFQYLPMLGNIIAFQDYSPFLGFFDSPWVGFSNFTRIFSDPDIGVVISNTLIISFLQVVFAFPVPIALALMLNAVSRDWFKRALQSVLYLPHFISWVIILSIFQQILGGDGLVNRLIRGMGGQPVEILTNPDFFKPMVVLQVIWKDSGWGTIIFLAALSTIDTTLYEAAVLDGANKWRRIWHITLPGIRSVIVLLLILKLGDILDTGFEQIFLQRQAVGFEAAEVLDTFVYFRGIQAGDWGYSAAVGLVKGLIGLIMIVAANKIAKKLGEEGLI